MQNMNRFPLLLILFSLIFSSCATYFTAADRKNITEGGASCKQVQFYNDKAIELKREISVSDANTVNGKVKVEKGKHYEYIFIPQKTKAACIDEKDKNMLKIAFEDNGTWLPFGSTKDGSAYNLGNTNKSSEPLKNGATITYGGKKYTITQGSDANLLFINELKIKETKERRIAKGVKVQ